MTKYLRLFVALELPEAARQALEDWQRDVVAGRHELRPVHANSLHATLRFLGACTPDAVPGIELACESVGGFPVGELALAGPLWLPRRRPRVLAVAITDSAGHLSDAQALLSGALAAGGICAPEKRPFFPHVTVARVRGSERVPEPELPPPAAVAFVPRSIALYRSHLGRGPAQYEVLKRISLAGAE